jgi:reelin
MPQNTPVLFRDAFGDDPAWPSIEGATVLGTSACSVIDSGSSLYFASTGSVERKALTPELDGRNMTYASFVVRATANCDGPGSISRSAGFFYSIDGAQSFTRLSTISLRATTETQVITLPVAARVRGLQLLFWQPSFSSGSDRWALDTLYVGNNMPGSTLLAEVNLDFTAADFVVDENTADVANGAAAQFCGQNALVFTNTSGAQRVETYGTNIGSDAYLQVVLSTGCGAATARSGIFIEASDDDGQGWQDIFTQCDRFFSSSCNTYYNYVDIPIAMEELAGGFHRVTVPLGTVPAGRRFRISTDRDRTGGSNWAIASLYIGSACLSYCNGHGTCRGAAGCLCDEGFQGEACLPDGSQPRELRELFDDDLAPLRWPVTHNVAIVSNGGDCVSQPDGPVVRFSGVGGRRLGTADLDLREALFVQYDIQLGMQNSLAACRSPSSRDDGVLVLYSTDGGVRWTVLSLVSYFSYRRQTTVTNFLPEDALTAATRLLWWQPHADGASEDVWTLDTVLVRYAQRVMPKTLYEDFAPVDTSKWLNTPHFSVGLCGGRENVFMSTTNGAEAVTRDLQLEQGNILVISSEDLPSAAGEGGSPFQTAPGSRVATACGASASWVFDQAVSGDVTRALITRPLDLSSRGLILSFTLYMGAGGCDPPDAGGEDDEDVYV